MADYRNWRPEDIWLKIRSGEIDYPTAGMCGGYAQANLVILPKKYADDFKEYAKRIRSHVRFWKLLREHRQFMTWAKAQMW